MSFRLYYFIGISGVFILLCWAVYIPYRIGQVYWGCIYTMIIGAYFTGYVARELGWHAELVIPAAVMAGILASFPPAIGLAKALGFTISIATTGLIFVIQTVIRNLDFLGGSLGLFHIPRVKHLLLILYIIIFIVGVLIYRLERSRIGRAMEVTASDSVMATVLGVNVYWWRVVFQVVSGALGALAGSLYAFVVGSLTPDSVGFPSLILVACFLFTGGHETMWGAVLAAPTLYALGVYLPESVTVLKYYIYGGLLILVFTIFPKGIITKAGLRRLGNWTNRFLFQRMTR